jgi:hypothetical protein
VISFCQRPHTKRSIAYGSASPFFDQGLASENGAQAGIPAALLGSESSLHYCLGRPKSFLRDNQPIVGACFPKPPPFWRRPKHGKEIVAFTGGSTVWQMRSDRPARKRFRHGNRPTGQSKLMRPRHWRQL